MKRRIAALLLALTLVFSLSLTAFAAPEPDWDEDQKEEQGGFDGGQDNPHNPRPSPYDPIPYTEPDDDETISPDSPEPETEAATEKNKDKTESAEETQTATEATEATEAPTETGTEKQGQGNISADGNTEETAVPERTGETDDEAVNRTAIIVVVICGAVLLLLLIVIISLLMRKKQPKPNDPADGDPAPGTVVRIEILEGACYNTEMQFRIRRNLTIGTDRGCDLVFDDPQMLPMHAVINADAEKLTIEECSETGITYIGGMKIFASNALRSGDVVTIGSTSFQIFFE